MKKSAFILAMTATVLFTTQCLAQENDSIVNNNEVKKYSYQFMGEFSTLQTGIDFIEDLEYNERLVTLDIPRISFILLNNIVYKEKISIGLGVGMEYGIVQAEMVLPLFVDFRYYFSEKNFKPFINVGAGINTTIIFTGLQLLSSTPGEIFIYKPGLYLNCSGGFKIGHFQLNAGINVKTCNLFDIQRNITTLDFVIKWGFNF
jgi:outer membrane protein W